MASSDKTPPDYRRSDPDETEGRRLYRILADRQARQDVGLTRRVRLGTDKAHSPLEATHD